MWPMVVGIFCCWKHGLHQVIARPFACWISQLRIHEAIRLQLERADYMEGFLLTQSHEDQQINVKGGEKKRDGRRAKDLSLVAFVCFFFWMCLFCFALFCFVGVFCGHLASCM